VRRALAAGLAIAMLLAAGSARADRVLVVEDAEMKRFGARLRAELRAVGFDVEVVDAPAGEPTRASLEDAGRAAGVVAALRLRASRTGVEVWVMDRVTSKTVLREVVLSNGDDESAVALGAIELLRASLLEVEEPQFTPREVPPTPAVLRLAPRRNEPPPKRLSLGLGPALAVSPGGLGATAQIDVWLRARFGDHAEGAIRLLAPTIPATVEAREGRATVALASAAFAADAVLLPPTSAFRVRVGAGVGALWAHMEGTATGGFVGRADDIVSVLSFVHGGVTYALSTNARVFGDLTVGIADPRPTVAFADRKVAAWGQPAMMTTLGLELAVF
jgi:hypothetical protein